MKKKEELILHIGMFKTGTTSIQESFFRCKKKMDVCYFNYGGANHSRPLIDMFAEETSRLLKRGGRNKVDVQSSRKKYFEMTKKSIEECQKERMLLSSEFLVKLQYGEIERIKNYFSKYFKKTTIVGYVRAPKSYMSSAFQESLKGGKSEFNFINNYPKYKESFEKFDAVFGLDNVRLWYFNPDGFPDRDIVKDFIEKLDIKMPYECINRKNESLSYEAASLLYIYNKFKIKQSGMQGNIARRSKANIVKRLYELPLTRKLYFSNSLFERIIRENYKDIKWIEDRINCDILANDNKMKGNESKVISYESDLLSIPEIENAINYIGNINQNQKLVRFSQIVKILDEINRK